jgi:hypothetical protein
MKLIYLLRKINIGPLSSSLKKDWSELVTPVLENASIEVPENNLFSLNMVKMAFILNILDIF